MKKISIFTIMAMSAAMSLTAAENVTIREIGNEKPKKITSSFTKADVIVNENFEAWASGSETAPDLTKCLGDEYGQLAKSEWIDPQYTHDTQWRGDLVYPAGGCCFINNKDPQSPNYLKTPMGDYSGEIKLTFLCRAVKTETASGILSGTGLSVTLEGNNPYKKFDSDIKKQDIRLYPHQGWCEVEITFNNYTADNDANFVFSVSGGLLLDDIRVTASNDNFIAPPTIKPITDVKADGFTINWEGVRKAYNYYVFLYEQTGFDEEGEPILKHVFSPEHLAMIENSGMSIEEYMEMMPEEYLTYEPAGSKSADDHLLRSYTFKGLDPEKEYWYEVRSHLVTLFSKSQKYHANVLATPTAKKATDITGNSFVAQWERTPKATAYDVNLYGITAVEEADEFFPLLDEDFSNVDEFTDATNLSQAENLWETYGDDFDFSQLVKMPGWECPDKDCVSLMKGNLVMNEWGAELATPQLDVAGAENISLYMQLSSPATDFTLDISFAGKYYQLKAEGTQFDAEVQLPTNGKTFAAIAFANSPQIPVAIDRILVSQSRPKGDSVFTWLSSTRVDAPETSVAFSDLDNNKWYDFGYDVTAVKATDGKEVRSNTSERMMVNHEYKGYADVKSLNVTEIVEVARYDINGVCIDKPVKGINIVRYSDGSVKKELR